MANDVKNTSKKMVEEITSMDVDFAQWYTDVVKKAELCGYTSVKGCMAIKPAGYAIWELIQKQLDARFKEAGVENVYMPMFIPAGRGMLPMIIPKPMGTSSSGSHFLTMPRVMSRTPTASIRICCQVQL